MRERRKKEEAEKASSSDNSTRWFVPPIEAPGQGSDALGSLPSIGQVLEVTVLLLGLDPGLG